MTLQEIYSKYKIPPNLQRHQIEVAAVGKYVCEHWVGSKIDARLVIESLLVHDLGNITKFKRPFMDELEAQGTYWEGIQQEFIQTYGSDPDQATYTILEQLGFTALRDTLIQMKAVWINPEKEVSWEARICEYADCCVTPKGIEGFEARMQDMEMRYGHGPGTSVHDAMSRNAELVEKNVDTDLRNVFAIDFSKEMKILINTSF